MVARLAREPVGWVALSFQSRQSLHAEVLFRAGNSPRAGSEGEADRCSHADELAVAIAGIPVALRALAMMGPRTLIRW